MMAKTAQKAPTAWENRIVGHGDEAPDQLLASPLNWRIHPLAQQEAMSGVLDQVGWLDEIIVNETTGCVINGHLRVSLALSRGEERVPVRYVRLSPDEERLALATFDPLGSLAVTDAQQLGELLAQVQSPSPAVMAELDALAQRAGLPGAGPGANGDADGSDDEGRDKAPSERETIYMQNAIKQIVLYFDHEQYLDVTARLERLRSALDFDNNTEVFLRLLEHYESSA